jgi:hypothetical protein
VVVTREGVAEVRRAGTNTWVALEIGDVVAASDEVRTAQGTVELAFGAMRMRVNESSEVTLEILAAKQVRAKVKGQVEADAGDGTLELVAGNAVARAQGGGVVVTIDAAGIVAVGSKGAKVKVVQGGESVELEVGQVSRSRGGKLAKVQPAKTVRLAVNWPEKSETNKKTLALSGSVDAGSRLLVQGKPIQARPDGSFKAEVALRAGKQKVFVAVVDPLGRRKQDVREFVLDPKAPDIRGQVEYP